jgi:hypothetical protein
MRALTTVMIPLLDKLHYWHRSTTPDTHSVLERLATEGVDALSDEERELIPSINDAITDDAITYDSHQRKPGTCGDLEIALQAVLFEEGEDPGNDYRAGTLYREGTIVTRDGIGIGLVQYEHDIVLLSSRNVRNTDGTYPLVKGGTYSIPRSAYAGLGRHDEWIVHPVDELTVRPGRMVFFKNSGLDCLNTENKPLPFDERLDEVIRGAERALRRDRSDNEVGTYVVIK